MANNTSKYHFKVTCEARRKRNKHHSFLVLFTGLSGAGKSTLANGLEQVLFKENIKLINMR